MNRLYRAALVAAAILAIGLAGGASVNAHPDTDHVKVWVCKYVGQPGDFETLKGGKQPITVSVNAADAYVGADFADGQNHSVVIDFQTDANTDKHNQYTGDAQCPAPAPSATPSLAPSEQPSEQPSMEPSATPSASVTPSASPLPSSSPTPSATLQPTAKPSPPNTATGAEAEDVAIQSNPMSLFEVLFFVAATWFVIMVLEERARKQRDGR